MFSVAYELTDRRVGIARCPPYGDNLSCDLEQQGFGAELEGGGDGPGGVAGGEQFRLAGFLVGGDATSASFIAESHFDVAGRSPASPRSKCSRARSSSRSMWYSP